jgi:hypothetical protein
MPIFNYEFAIGIDMYIPTERHRGPLPDFDPDLFADFSLRNGGTDMGQSAKPLSVSGALVLARTLTPPRSYFVVI